MCIYEAKNGKPLVSQTGSGKSVSNGDDNEDNDKHDNHNFGEELEADDSVSQIGEKRTHKEAGLKVDEDDLGAYHKNSTGTEDVD